MSEATIEHQAVLEDECRDCGKTVAELEAEGEPSEIINGLCENCESDYVWCEVCQQMIDEDTASYRHRHLYWDSEIGDWRGIGTYMDERDYQTVRDSLSFLCDLIGGTFVTNLAYTIQTMQMGFDSIHFSGSMLGYSSLNLSLHVPPPHTNRWSSLWFYSITDSEIRRWNEQCERDDLEEALTPAIQWLIGLDNDKTEKDNHRTLEWLNSWMLRPDPCLQYVEGLN